MSERTVVVRIHRQDTIDWLDGDSELADRYMDEVARRMAADLNAEVAVEDGYRPGSADGGVTYDSACDDGIMQEAQDAYEAACADLVIDWDWAE